MIQAETIVTSYIDINLLMVGSALIWFAGRQIIKNSDAARAFAAQLHLVKILLLVTFFFPAFLTFFSYYFASASPIPVTLSELVLAQFLQGNIEVNPSFLESVLTFRQNVMTQLSDPNHVFITLVLYGGLATALFMIVRALLTMHKLSRILSEAHEWRTSGHLKLMLADRIRIPFSTRMWRYHYVVLPSTMLGNQIDMKVSVAHELQHLRQRDVDWEFIFALLTPVFFWNPAFHYFKREIEELRELSCDQNVLKRGLLSAREYCECLIRVCGGRFKRNNLFKLRVPEVALIQTRSGLFTTRPKKLLENRLMSAVTGGNGVISRARLIVVAAMMISLAGTLSFAVQKPADWSHDRLMLSTIINLERLEKRNQVGLGSYTAY
ncbi:M56 family metallopeptidase [Lentilitoribacter sp. Alg239-R112]|uniref:M56 family metallopeptidase n=1 Tax=Lentilitoribacter sp. Alg239-R112 TaxID=2305987 RepID=UPI0013A6A5B1|nr:M56 family metallopeptidase [Lentilitoribacter sp. Alg239-R112]